MSDLLNDRLLGEAGEKMLSRHFRAERKIGKGKFLVRLFFLNYESSLYLCIRREEGSNFYFYLRVLFMKSFTYQVQRLITVDHWESSLLHDLNTENNISGNKPKISDFVVIIISYNSLGLFENVSLKKKKKLLVTLVWFKVRCLHTKNECYELKCEKKSGYMLYSLFSV